MKYVFFGSSEFSRFVLDELVKAGFSPVFEVTSAKAELPMDKLRELDADVFVVASFGKILPAELIYMPKHKTLNVHPSLLPKLRGPAPIQGAILGENKTGVTIMRMDEKMDNGPIVAQEEVTFDTWPMHYALVEDKLARAGGKLLAKVLPEWISGNIEEVPQDSSTVTYTKLIKTEDALIDLSGKPDENLKKVYAYSTSPGAYIKFQGSRGEKRVIIKDARIVDGQFVPIRVLPEGKKEMDWESFLRGNA
jgi:methionyl-tRNA formyltransferase